MAEPNISFLFSSSSYDAVSGSTQWCLVYILRKVEAKIIPLNCGTVTEIDKLSAIRRVR